MPASLAAAGLSNPGSAFGSTNSGSTNSDAIAAVPTSAAPQTTANDWFAATQQRLRDLGATHYKLESWGDQGQWFRFHCEVATSNLQQPQPFEATDSSPERAMQTVARQIENWRVAGQIDQTRYQR
jgi:hypothetical protein